MARWLILVVLGGCSYAQYTITRGDESGDPVGDTVTGAGDALSGDPLSGDPYSGDPVSGDTPSGDSSSGDPLFGDPLSGDPPSGDPPSGDPPSGDPLLQAGDPPISLLCPIQQPLDQSACINNGLECAYGDDPRDSCRVIATCETGTWSVYTPPCEDPVMSGSCPTSLHDAADERCDEMGTYCFYGDFACLCTNCPPSAPVCGGEPAWWCEEPNSDPDCPEDRPMLGTTCSPPDKVCTYVCGFHGAVICTDGTWHAHTAYACPVSSRRYKQNIDYLGSDELARIAEELLAVRLAEYEYIHRPADRHLGFITEDHPDLPAVGPDGASVDLYTYTSMILATLQVQARKIEALERELEELRAGEAAPLVCEPP